MSFNIAYGVTKNDNSNIRVDTSKQHANVDKIDDTATGRTTIEFDSGFNRNPAVIVTPIADSEKQARIEHFSEDDSARRSYCKVDTYDQDGYDNDGLRDLPYSFLAATGDTPDADVSNLHIVACLVDGTNNKEFEINYGSSGLSSGATGIYTIHFAKPFLTPPTVAATLARYSPNEASSDYRSVVISAIYADRVTIKVFDQNSELNDEWFTLVAIGQVASGGNASDYKIACGYISRTGKTDEDGYYDNNIDTVDYSDDATYQVNYNSGFFASNKPPVVLACTEHDDEENVRQAQVWQEANSACSMVQVAEPEDGGYDNSRFHIIAIAEK